MFRCSDNSGTRWRATYTPSVDADVSAVSFSVDGLEDPAGNIVSTASSFASDAPNSISERSMRQPPQLVLATCCFLDQRYVK